MVDGLWSSPAEDAAWTNIRFGQVGPGIELNHWSHSANEVASAYDVGSWLAVSKPSMMSPMGPAWGRRVLVGRRRVVGGEATHVDGWIWPARWVGRPVPASCSTTSRNSWPGSAVIVVGAGPPTGYAVPAYEFVVPGGATVRSGIPDCPKMWSNERFSSMRTKTLRIGE